MATLYIVATPIGNLEDITFRAVETLMKVDLIACEDTRHTKRLLERYKIITPCISYHQYSKAPQVQKIIQELKAGKNIALVTDAGTPGISDPGNKLVAAVSAYPDITVVAIPGPSALTAAASISGLPTDEFLFLGFLPHKKGRETLFKEINESQRTVIFYESTHRIVKTLERLAEVLPPQRQIAVARELTKQFETIYRGNTQEVLEKLKNDSTKGEFVVIVEGR